MSDADASQDKRIDALFTRTDEQAGKLNDLFVGHKVMETELKALTEEVTQMGIVNTKEHSNLESMLTDVSTVLKTEKASRDGKKELVRWVATVVVPIVSVLSAIAYTYL